MGAKSSSEIVTSLSLMGTPAASDQTLAGLITAIVALLGSGAIAAAGARLFIASASLAGSGGVTTTGSLVRNAIVSLVGSGGIVATGIVLLLALVELLGSAALRATIDPVQAVFSVLGRAAGVFFGARLKKPVFVRGRPSKSHAFLRLKG